MEAHLQTGGAPVTPPVTAPLWVHLSDGLQFPSLNLNLNPNPNPGCTKKIRIKIKIRNNCPKM